MAVTVSLGFIRLSDAVHERPCIRSSIDFGISRFREHVHICTSLLILIWIKKESIVGYILSLAIDSEKIDVAIISPVAVIPGYLV